MALPTPDLDSARILKGCLCAECYTSFRSLLLLRPSCIEAGYIRILTDCTRMLSKIPEPLRK
jgi:hypothetical protein